MIALLIFVAIPNVAYAAADRELTPREERQFWRYAERVCGPEGTVDTDPVPDARGRYYAEPHCNRDGWNGHRYVRPTR
jgi:hypothetical protein